MKPPMSERRFQLLVKSIVQTGKMNCEGVAFTAEQEARIKAAFDIYKRRDKSKPLSVEVTIDRSRKQKHKPHRDNKNKPQPQHQSANCWSCGEPIWLVKADRGMKPCEPGTHEKHLCYYKRFLGGAFESNRRKH